MFNENDPFFTTMKSNSIDKDSLARGWTNCITIICKNLCLSLPFQCFGLPGEKETVLKECGWVRTRAKH